MKTSGTVSAPPILVHWLREIRRSSQFEQTEDDDEEVLVDDRCHDYRIGSCAFAGVGGVAAVGPGSVQATGSRTVGDRTDGAGGAIVTGRIPAIKASSPHNTFAPTASSTRVAAFRARRCWRCPW
jgi:hypothetical protein